MTCDEYPVDHVADDPVPHIRKYYHYRSQFDVQVFGDGSFIENNGRGSIGFGTCTAR